MTSIYDETVLVLGLRKELKMKKYLHFYLNTVDKFHSPPPPPGGDSL